MRSLQFLTVLITFFFSAVSCKSKVPSAGEEVGVEETSQYLLTKSQFDGSGMQTDQLKEYDFNDVVFASGFIEAPVQDKAKISAVIAGHVCSNPLMVGDEVKKGQVVLSLENPDIITLQQDFAEASFQLSYLQAEFERQKSLLDENIASQKVFARAESDYKSMKVKLEGLRKKLVMINIDPAHVLEGKIVSQIDLVSPFSGFVSALFLTRGMYVSPGDVLLEVIDNSHLHLALYVYETDAMKLKVGQGIRFRVTQSGNDYYDGEVIMVGKSVEGPDRKVIVHGHINKSDSPDFISGMFVEAEIFVRQRRSCGLPNEAIASEGGKKFIFVLKSTDSENLVFEKRYVETGQTSEELTEVFCKNDSCTVLVKGAFNLAEGD